MYSDFLKNELKSRWERLQNEMKNASIDASIITSNVNLLYLSSRIFSGSVYVPADGEPIFFVRRPVGLEGENVVYIRKPEDIPSVLKEKRLEMPRKVALEADVMPFSEYMRYKNIFPEAQEANLSAMMRVLRAVKSPYEISLLEKSADLHSKSYAAIPSLFKKGMTDTDLSIEIEREFRRNGSLGIFRVAGESMEIFMGSILVGNNADNPSPYDFAMGGQGVNPSLPVGGNGTPITDGMSVMVDVGGNFTGYMTDMTRVFSCGKLTDLAYKAHECALEIQRKMEETAKEGVSAADIYNMSVEIAVAAGVDKYFMGYSQKAGFVGHGLGIEINESPVFAPRSRDILKENMVFAFEPKFVIPDVGAVGVENTVVVLRDGVRKITLFPEEIIEL